MLVEKAQCPKCSSTKCRVEDLLPNLSLRQAIDHFLESQILLSGSDDAFHRYAPGERINQCLIVQKKKKKKLFMMLD